MTKYKVFFTIFLIVMLSNIYVVKSANATTMSMKIPKGEKISQTIELKEGDQLAIQFTVIGQMTNLISFSINFPNSAQISYGEVTDINQTLQCNATGEYILNFINNDNTEDKLVTLNYNIEHYIFGIPKLFFFAIIIALICLVMIAAIALMGKSI